MAFRLPEILVDLLGSVHTSITIFVALVLLISRLRESRLDAIPTVGSSTWLGSLWAGVKFSSNAAYVIQEGYVKHKSSPFKVADLYRWVVVLSNREHIEELVRATGEDFSFREAAKDRLHTRYTLPQETHENRYHIMVIRSQLTRSIGSMCPAIRDEIITAFDDALDLKANEWKSVPALSVVQNIVCRASNRLFVGLPLCRNPDWIDLNIRFTIDLVKTGGNIGLFPKFLRPLAAPFFSVIDRNVTRGIKLLHPIIEERLKCLHEYGPGAEMPSDLLSWLIEEAKDAPLTAESLTIRVLIVNFVGIFTTSISFTHALFHLAENPQYIQPLREEVEAIVKKDGWTKAALAKMRKVDSFLKECQRITGTGFLNVIRVAMRDYTFADGTFIPKGTTVGVGAHAIHHDDNVYENSHAFEPFRFVDTDENRSAKNRFVSTGIDYLSFGHGKQACPGRFFAANELKSLLAHTIMTYDVKLDNDTMGPRSLSVGTGVTPNPCTHVLFRKRVD